MPNRDDSNFFSEEEFDENFKDNNEEENNNGEENFLNKNETLYAMELDHLDNRLYKEINLAVLKESITIASSSLFWRFRGVKYRVNRILDIYYTLVGHVNSGKNDIV